MKKLWKTFMLTLAMILGSLSFGAQNAEAVSFNVNAKDNKNGSVTVAVSGQCVGAFNVDANGHKAQLAIKTLGGSDSTTLKTGAGTVTVKVTAISIADANYNIEEGKVISKTVKVTNGTTSSGSSQSSGNHNSGNSNHSSQTNPAPTPTPPKPQKSTDNNLKTLTVSEGKLSPEFKKSTTSYSVEVCDDIESITIKGVANDTKAKVSGDGTKILDLGENNFNVLVTSESGKVKTYSISVYVKETPKIFVSFQGKKLGVLNDLGKVETPKGAVKTTVKVGGDSVTALNVGNMTLLYLLNQETNKADFYIYKDESVVGVYQYLEGFNEKYVAVESTCPNELKDNDTMKEITVKIGNMELKGYKVDEMEFPVVYLMNEDGICSFYTYDEQENSLQKWDFNKIPIIEENRTMNMIVSGLGVTVGLLTIALIYQSIMFKRFKKQSISSLREYYKEHAEDTEE